MQTNSNRYSMGFFSKPLNLTSKFNLISSIFLSKRLFQIGKRKGQICNNNINNIKMVFGSKEEEIDNKILPLFKENLLKQKKNYLIQNKDIFFNDLKSSLSQTFSNGDKGIIENKQNSESLSTYSNLRQELDNTTATNTSRAITEVFNSTTTTPSTTTLREERKSKGIKNKVNSPSSSSNLDCRQKLEQVDKKDSNLKLKTKNSVNELNFNFLDDSITLKKNPINFLREHSEINNQSFNPEESTEEEIKNKNDLNLITEINHLKSLQRKTNTINLRDLKSQNTHSVRKNKSNKSLNANGQGVISTSSSSLIYSSQGLERLEEQEKIIKNSNLTNYLNFISPYNLSTAYANKRLFIKYSKVLNYNFNSLQSKKLDKNQLFNDCYKLLVSVFKSMYCLISKPVFLITPNKMTIQLFYFLTIPSSRLFKWLKLTHSIISCQDIRVNEREENKRDKSNSILVKKNKIKNNKNPFFNFRKFKKSLRIFRSKNYFFIFKLIHLNNRVLTLNFPNKFKILLDILSRLFNKPVELDLIRLHHPYFDSNILVNLLGLIVKKKNIRYVIKKIYDKKNGIKNKFNQKKINKIPAFLSGLKINIGGRLLKQAIIPRKTTKLFEKGATSRGKVNMLDQARITNKNKRGTFTIKVTSGQKFF